MTFRRTAVLAMLAGACLAGAAPRARAAIEGYVWPLSVAPGETLSVMVSSPTSFQLAFARYHRQGDQNASDFVTSPVTLPALVQVAPDSAWKGCTWTPNTRFVIPAGWTSGIYGAECSAAGTSTARIAFVVRPLPATPADFCVLANTNTWNAYNDWGGESKYTTPAAHVLGFLRPNPSARPTSGSAPNHVTRAELWVHDWLATNGYHVDTYSDWDFHRGIPGLDRYKAILLDTHPEYWTREMRDQLDAYLAHGGCLLYLGGDGVHEETVFSADGTSLTMFPEGYCGSNTCRRPSYFCNLTPPRSERAVLGVAYRSDGFNTYAPFAVTLASHRFFTGTGLANGDTIGSQGLNGGGASGWEMDTSIPGLAPDGVIVSCSGTDDRGSPPANLELLARGRNAGGYGADMTYYATPSGGGVFAAGSLSFGGSLVVDPQLQAIVRNVLDEFLHRSMLGVPAPPRRTASAPAWSRAAPNPFSSSTTIVCASTLAAPARAQVYDLGGRLVRDLGLHDARAVTWDGRDDAGRTAPEGLYLVRLASGGHAESRRVLRLR